MNSLKNTHTKKGLYFKDYYYYFYTHQDGFGQYNPQIGFVDPITNSFFLWFMDALTTRYLQH